MVAVQLEKRNEMALQVKHVESCLNVPKTVVPEYRATKVMKTHGNTLRWV